MKKLLFLIVGVLGFHLSVLGQINNFPVSVNGLLVPPNSLRIGDYFDGTLKGNDLMFTVILNDPKRRERQVRFRLSVKSNGGTILTTPNDFIPEIITLQMGVPEMYRGDDLLPYWQAIQSRGVGGIPKFLTPGLNGICLEVIDILTGKVISNVGCGEGFFNLAQPPMLQSPTCEMEIEQSSSQNILFNWLPMHNASGNPISVARYTFQLVEFAPFHNNAQDAFAPGNMPLYEEELENITALTYTESAPILEKGKKYAWRVKAESINLFGEVVPLFANNGFSEICTFDYLDPAPPPDPVSFSSCTGSPCFFSGNINTDPKGQDFFPQEIVKLGYFKLKFNDVSYDDGTNSYSGTGSVFVDFLSTNISVEFNDLQVNKFDRVYGGSVKAIVDDETVVPADFIGDFNLMSAATASNVDFPDDVAQSLFQYFESNPTKLTSNLRQAGQGANSGLPIGLNVNSNSTGLNHVIAISDIQFTGNKAILNAAYVVKDENGTWTKFGAKGVCFREKGLVDQSPAMYLMEDVTMTKGGTSVVLETFSGGTGTKLNWSCDGFESYEIKGRFEFDESQVKPANPIKDKVIAKIQGNTDNIFNFSVETTVPEFVVVGMPDFKFKSEKAYFDFSNSGNEDGMTFPEGYGESGNGWIGVFMKDIKLSLPEILQNSSGQAPVIDGNNFLFDGNGLSGEFSGSNVLDQNSSDVDGWKIGMNKFEVAFDKNAIKSSNIEGTFTMPINGGGNIAYTGDLIDDSDVGNGESVKSMKLDVTPGNVDFDALRATLNLYSNSFVNIPVKDGKFVGPKSDFSGQMSFDIEEGDTGFDTDYSTKADELHATVAGSVAGDLNSKLLLSGIDFSNMIFDRDAEQLITFGDLIPPDGSFSFSGVDCELTDLAWQGINLGDGSIGTSGFRFAFKFGNDILGSSAPQTTFDLAFAENTQAGPSSIYDFQKFNLDFGLGTIASAEYDISCEDNLPPVDLGNTQPIADASSLTAIQVGYFAINNLLNVQSSGNGKFSGEGVIEVENFVGFEKVAVDFSNVVINTDGRIVSGEVKAKVDDGQSAADSESVLANISTKVESIGSGGAFSLPIPVGYNEEGELDRDQPLVVMDITFLPTVCKIDAKVIIEFAEDNYAEFAGDDILMVSKGIRAGDDTKLGLANEFDYDFAELQTILKVKKEQEGEESFAALDCGGVAEFQLIGDYEFYQEALSDDDESTPWFTSDFQVSSTQWGEFIGTIGAVDSTDIENLPDFAFSFEGAKLDLTTLTSVEDMEYPDGFEGESGSEWRGVLIPEVTVHVPKAIMGINNPQMTAANMIIDANGVSGVLVDTALVAMGEATIGIWPFSLDEFEVTILSNEFEKANIQGALQLPIMQGEEAMPIEGDLKLNEVGNGYEFTLSPVADEKTKISMMRAEVVFSKNGKIKTSFSHGKSGVFSTPKAELSGRMAFEVKNKDGEVSKKMAKFLKDFRVKHGLKKINESFSTVDIEFEGMRFHRETTNTYGEQVLIPQFTINRMRAVDNGVTFMGKKSLLSSINAIEFKSAKNAELDLYEPDVILKSQVKRIDYDSKALTLDIQEIQKGNFPIGLGNYMITFSDTIHYANNLSGLKGIKRNDIIQLGGMMKVDKFVPTTINKIEKKTVPGVKTISDRQYGFVFQTTVDHDNKGLAAPTGGLEIRLSERILKFKPALKKKDSVRYVLDEIRYIGEDATNKANEIACNKPLPDIDLSGAPQKFENAELTNKGIKVNYFTMGDIDPTSLKYVSATKTYSGKGTITLPFLKHKSQKIKVDFKDVKINENRRMIAGKIATNNLLRLKDTEMAYFDNAVKNSKDPKVEGNSFPILLNKPPEITSVPNDPKTYDPKSANSFLVLTDIELDSSSSSIKGYLYTMEQGGENQKQLNKLDAEIKIKTDSIQICEKKLNEIGADHHLYLPFTNLIRDLKNAKTKKEKERGKFVSSSSKIKVPKFVNKEPFKVKIAPKGILDKELPINPEGQMGSLPGGLVAEDMKASASCSCGDIGGFNLSFNFQFPTSKLRSIRSPIRGNPIPVIGKVDVSAQSWGDWIFNVDLSDTAFIPKLRDYPMIISGLTIDASKKADMLGYSFPKGYDPPLDGSWRGLILDKVLFSIPNIPGNVFRPKVIGEKILWDTDGLTGTFGLADIVNNNWGVLDPETEGENKRLREDLEAANLEESERDIIMSKVSEKGSQGVAAIMSSISDLELEPSQKTKVKEALHERLNNWEWPVNIGIDSLQISFNKGNLKGGSLVGKLNVGFLKSTDKVNKWKSDDSDKDNEDKVGKKKKGGIKYKAMFVNKKLTFPSELKEDSTIIQNYRDWAFIIDPDTLTAFSFLNLYFDKQSEFKIRTVLKSEEELQKEKNDMKEIMSKFSRKGLNGRTISEKYNVDNIKRHKISPYFNLSGAMKISQNFDTPEKNKKFKDKDKEVSAGGYQWEFLEKLHKLTNTEVQLVPKLEFDSLRVTNWKYDFSKPSERWTIDEIVPQTEFTFLIWKVKFRKLNFGKITDLGIPLNGPSVLSDQDTIKKNDKTESLDGYEKLVKVEGKENVYKDTLGNTIKILNHYAAQLKFDLTVPVLGNLPFELGWLYDETIMTKKEKKKKTYSLGGKTIEVQFDDEVHDYRFRKSYMKPPDLYNPEFQCLSPTAFKMPEDKTGVALSEGMSVKMGGYGEIDKEKQKELDKNKSASNSNSTTEGTNNKETNTNNEGDNKEGEVATNTEGDNKDKPKVNKPFTLKITNASKGEGTVKVPFMKRSFPVKFDPKKIKVNAAGELVEGTIYGDYDPTFVTMIKRENEIYKLLGRPPLWKDSGVPTVQMSDSLIHYLFEENKALRRANGVELETDPNQQGTNKEKVKGTKTVKNLPISLKNTLASNDAIQWPSGENGETVDMVMTGLYFEPTMAYINMVLIMPGWGLDETKRFALGAAGIQIRPEGLSLGDLKLYLAEDIKW